MESSFAHDDSIVPVDKREYDKTALYVEHGSGVLAPTAGAVLRALSESYCNAQVDGHGIEDRVNIDVGDRLPCLVKLQTRCIDFHRKCVPHKPDYAIAPVHTLISEWLYEHLRPTSMGHDGVGKGRLNAILEEYVGMILNCALPTARRGFTKARIQPTSGCKVIDWARVVQ